MHERVTGPIGQANFNWRFAVAPLPLCRGGTLNGPFTHPHRYLYQLSLPSRHVRVLVQVWDSRATGPNDALAECCIDLKLLYMNLMRLQKTQEVERQLYDMSFAGEHRHAKLDMSVELLPRHEAEKLEALAGKTGVMKPSYSNTSPPASHRPVAPLVPCRSWEKRPEPKPLPRAAPASCRGRSGVAGSRRSG